MKVKGHKSFARTSHMSLDCCSVSCLSEEGVLKVTRSPKPETRKLKPETNSKPKTLDPRP